MALPVGVSTCTVTYGSALTYLGEVSTISAALTADRSVVWSATGVSLNSGGDQLTANAGLALSFSVPHVDQTGFVNNAGDAVTNWYYTLTGVVTFATGEKMSFRKNFQVLVGQSTLDLDLIPDNATVLPAVVVDAPPVTSVAGLTGAVSAEDLGDALSATFAWTTDWRYIGDGDFVGQPGELAVRRSGGTDPALDYVDIAIHLAADTEMDLNGSTLPSGFHPSVGGTIQIGDGNDGSPAGLVVIAPNAMASGWTGSGVKRYGFGRFPISTARPDLDDLPGSPTP